MAISPRRLLVISHVAHYRHEGQLYAYGPYAREIDIWADLFPEVTIAAPCHEAVPPGVCVPFTRANIQIRPLKETGGETLRAKATQMLALPGLLWDLMRSINQADAVHIRCPGNLGLLGAILTPLFSRPRVAKYAGQWGAYPGEQWTVRLQRAILRSAWWRAPVTVYGRWQNQPSHVVPFFTSVLTQEQIARARAAAEGRRPTGRFNVLYVGRLSAAKNVDVLLSAVAELKNAGVDVKCSVLGDGPQRTALEAQASRLKVDDRVRFVGGVDFQQVLGHYEQADVLVLASESEGWPKAIAEGMAFGLICVGSNRGLVPEMLGEGRGIVVPPRDVDALVDALKQIARSPENFEPMRELAAAWAQKYSLEGLRDSLRELLSAHWGVTLSPRVPATRRENSPRVDETNRCHAGN